MSEYVKLLVNKKYVVKCEWIFFLAENVDVECE